MAQPPNAPKPRTATRAHVDRRESFVTLKIEQPVCRAWLESSLRWKSLCQNDLEAGQPEKIAFVF